MRFVFSSIQFWTYALLVVFLSPVIAYFGMLWGWTPGACLLPVLTVPTFIVALAGNRSIAISIAVLASIAGFAEAGYLSESSAGLATYVLPLLSSGVFLSLAGWTATIIDNMKQRLARLEERNALYVRDLYQRERAENQDTESRDLKRTRDPQPANESDEDADASVNFAMLLLTLQDIGRRVSTNLDPETLIPTIISTAKSSLKCQGCEVFLWNSQDESLKNALAPRSRDREAYVPRPETGMSGWVIQQRQILTRKDVESDCAMRAMQDEDPNMPDAIAPLAVGGELLGLLVIDKIEKSNPTFLRLLYILANIYALGIKNAQLFKRIEEMARHDGLTGLINHASFQQDLRELIEQASASSEPLTVIMGDVDHFKKFNDTHGHQAGDHVLREVSRLWEAVMPTDAVVARYGGEEFICALPHDDTARGRELAEMLRQELESHTIDFEGKQLKVTTSMGVAELGRPSRTAEKLVKCADEALYEAKEAGRNCVVCSNGAVPVTSEPPSEKVVNEHSAGPTNEELQQ